MISNNRLEYST